MAMRRCDTVEPAETGPCLCHSPGFARLNALVEAKFSRRSFLAGASAMLGGASLYLTEASAAIPAPPAAPVVFRNIQLFDGVSKTLQSGRQLVVKGTLIDAIEPNGTPIPDEAILIDGHGGTLMPGLIDAHWHAMMAALPMNELMTADIGYITLIAAEEAHRTLLRGFTSIRDMAGPSFALKRAIDSGLNAGPRIWPSGAMISQTSGHGDFRFPYEIPSPPAAPLSHSETLGADMISDGVDQVLKRVREQLMLGASQVKLAAGGGVTSHYDPLDVSQYTEAEFRAAVACAENWNTYVTVHAYTSRAIQTAVHSGVRCVEHGQLMDETTARLLAEKDVWLCLQAFLDNQFANPHPEGSKNRAKQLAMFAGTDRAYQLARHYKIKTAWGTDILFNPTMTKNQGAILTTLSRWYDNADILRMATGTNGTLLQLCGPRSPYPGKIGVLEKGAYADLLLVDGNPLTDITLIANPDRNFKIIMKDGRFYKNTLAA
ncbi:Prolidase [Granulibacter bethesdensis]|nr:Prolidase [Granulibacter bethesdensis]